MHHGILLSSSCCSLTLSISLVSNTTFLVIEDLSVQDSPLLSMNINEPDAGAGFALPFHNRHNPTLKDRGSAERTRRLPLLSWLNDDVRPKSQFPKAFQIIDIHRLGIILLPC